MSSVDETPGYFGIAYTENKTLTGNCGARSNDATGAGNEFLNGTKRPKGPINLAHTWDRTYAEMSVACNYKLSVYLTLAVVIIAMIVIFVIIMYRNGNNRNDHKNRNNNCNNTIINCGNNNYCNIKKKKNSSLPSLGVNVCVMYRKYRGREVQFKGETEDIGKKVGSDFGKERNRSLERGGGGGISRVKLVRGSG